MQVQGHAERAFGPLVEAFERMLRGAPGGAALSVMHRGRTVVDVWGGKRDAEGRPWERDTATVVYSTTKGVATTAVHVLVDRGMLRYGDPVARYWPEFARGGKSTITVRDLLTHRAGLYDAGRIVGHARNLVEWDRVIAAIAEAEPGHRGPRSSYHGITYGHVVGGLVERVTGMRFSRFVREAIAEPLGLEGFHVGAPASVVRHAARLVHARGVPQKPPGVWALERGWAPPFFGPLRQALLPEGMLTLDLSSEEFLSACIPAANGLFTARDLAKLYGALAEGGAIDGTRLLGSTTVARASEPQVEGLDRVLLLPLGWRLGYHRIGALSAHALPRAFGHFGFGGSGGWCDPERRLALAFVVNYGIGTPLGDVRILQMNAAALRCADLAERLPKLAPARHRPFFERRLVAE